MKSLQEKWKSNLLLLRSMSRKKWFELGKRVNEVSDLKQAYVNQKRRTYFNKASKSF